MRVRVPAALGALVVACTAHLTAHIAAKLAVAVHRTERESELMLVRVDRDGGRAAPVDLLLRHGVGQLGGRLDGRGLGLGRGLDGRHTAGRLLLCLGGEDRDGLVERIDERLDARRHSANLDGDGRARKPEQLTKKRAAVADTRARQLLQWTSAVKKN